MKPKNPTPSELSQLQLFQARLDSQLNPDHPLLILAGLIDWDRFDEAYADNLSWIRRLTITLIKQNSRKGSIVGKRRKAAWSFDFLLELIKGTQEKTEKQG